MWSGSSARSQRGDRAPPEALPHHAVVVEHGTPSRGEPHVALEARRAQPQGEPEGLQGVLRGVGPGPRCAKPIGGRAATAAEWARRPIVPDRSEASWWSSRRSDDDERTAQGHGPGGPRRMATVIKASCHDCGDVELTVARPRGAGVHPGRAGHLRLPLPPCQMSVVKPAERRMVDLLVASGVAARGVGPPRRAVRAPRRRPISHDDLLDFHRLLQDDGWFDSVVASS